VRDWTSTQVGLVVAASFRIGLDRAAHLRGDADALEALLAKPETGVLPMWRGKPLIAGEDRGSPAWQSPDHPIFAHADEGPIFLGLDDGTARFSRDISNWEPDENLETLNQFLDPSEQHFPGMPDDQRFSELRAIMTHLSARDAEFVPCGLHRAGRDHRGRRPPRDV